jgi:hypothetical protein
MKNCFFSSMLLAALTVTQVFAQPEFSAELRLRPEYRNGYKQLPDSGSGPAVFMSQRTRLACLFEKDAYKVFISIQDVRVWGDEQKYSSTGITGDDASIDVKEAWLEWNFYKYFSLKAGRQEFKYSDQRLLGARNWNQSGMSYDALLFSYKNNIRVDVGISYNNDKEPVFLEGYNRDKIKTLDFLYLSKDLNDKIKLEGLYVLSGVQSPVEPRNTYVRHTMGGLAELDQDLLFLNGSAYYQAGINKNGDKVSAWLLNGNIGMKSEPVELTAGFDIISGQDQGSPDSSYIKKDHRFDNLYGARHSYNGDMDYFSNLNTSTDGGGLIDLYVSGKYLVQKNFSVKIAYHYFRLQSDIILADEPPEPTDPENRYLASEIDLTMTCKLHQDIDLVAGYSFLKGSRTLHRIQDVSYPPDRNAQWGWIMLTVKPVFKRQATQ